MCCMCWLWLSYIGTSFLAQAATLPFLTVWRTATPNESITLPLEVAVYDLNISWGDGQWEIINGTANATHLYSLAGLYNMSIVGDITRFRFNSQGDAAKLMEIASWGDGFIMNNASNYTFAGCMNLQVSAPAATQPVIVSGATLEGMFANTSFNSALDWNLANATSVASMFGGAQNMNQPLTFTNTLGVTSTARMFQGAIAFNQPFTMQTDNVVDMQFMFQGATAFNQAVTLNTGKVKSMSFMFADASSFNQAINFDGSGLLDASYMFHYAAAFNSTLNLTNTVALTTTQNMFSGAFSFNQPITFRTDKVFYMGAMFEQATAFNQPVTFNTSKAGIMHSMFSLAYAFNQPINFDTTFVGNTGFMFYWATSFNSPVNFTNTTALATTAFMFANTPLFNQPITFRTDNVFGMDFMFAEAAAFNQPVPFNTSKVQSMQNMFYGASAFNQPINFDGTSLLSADSMFANASSFNNVVNLTNTSAALTSVAGMFQNALAFNQPISIQTSNVVNMDNMFSGATSFNQPINFNTTNLGSADSMFAGASAFNSSVSFATATTVLANTANMFADAAVFNQALGFSIANVSNMSNMFKGATSFNQALPWPSTDTSNVLSMTSMFEDAVSFDQPINFQVDNLVTADNMLRGARNFNQPVVLLNSNNLTSLASMLANATAFNQTVSVSSTANVISMTDMFVNVLGFEQDLRTWNVSEVADCLDFCYRCGLPNFQLCTPCGTAGVILTSGNGMPLCNCLRNETLISSMHCGTVAPTIAPSTPVPTGAPTTPVPTTPAPTDAPTTQAPTTQTPTKSGYDLCKRVQVGSTLQVACVDVSLPPSPLSLISPLFNITATDDHNNSVFVFTLPIDPRLYTSVGMISRPCESQQLSCEWQDPETLEFQRSGCAVSKERVDMGSGMVGAECTCTHLTVFAIALRSELHLAPLCQAQNVDYVLLALYTILGVSLVVQVARILKYQQIASRRTCCEKYVGRRRNSVEPEGAPSSRSASPSSSRSASSSSSASLSSGASSAAQVSLAQHSLLLLVCVLRIVYLAAKPVIGSLAGLVALGLLPSAITLSLFVHLLLTWVSVQLATFVANPFARFRVPFLATTLLVFVVVISLAVVTGVVPEVDTVRDGSYVLATLHAVVCVLVLLAGLGMRKSIPVVDSVRSLDWRVVFRRRLLLVTLGLSACLFLVACLWVAAVQTDIVTSTAATLATTASFYVFDCLSLCVLTWLFSFPVKEAKESHQRGAAKDSNRNTSRLSLRTKHKKDDSKRQEDTDTNNCAIELDT